MGIDILFVIAILILSIIVHEVAHGVAANALGDPTARLQGRLTLNPISHIDPLGSVVIPAILVLSHSPLLFGWAKPVPYNPYNFTRGGKWAEAIVAGAGPAINIVLALFFGLIVRFGTGFLSPEVITLAFTAVFINILLAFFNMIPIPPLDGSKVLASALPYSLAHQYGQVRHLLERNFFLGFGIVIVFVLVFGDYFIQLIDFVSRLIAGV